MARTRVFVDTNVILEAVRTGCWAALCSRYSVETVDRCIEEVRTGDPYDTSRVQVSDDLLGPSQLVRHAVSAAEVGALVLAFPRCQGLDAGELHLLAHLHAHENPADVLVLLSTADRAALVSASVLGWGDRLEALEPLAQQAGAGKSRLAQLKRHYSRTWLEQARTQIALDRLQGRI